MEQQDCSRRMETVQEEDDEQHPSRRQESGDQDEEVQAGEPRRMDVGGQQSSSRMENVPAGWKPTPLRSRQGAREKKKRGPDRQGLPLGCKKKQEKSLKRKMKKKMNIGRGKAVCPPKRKGKGSNVENEAPISVMFVDNTVGGQLGKRLQAEELRMGRMTG